MPGAIYTYGHSAAVTGVHAARTAVKEAAFFLPSLKPGMRVLDAGCGPGLATLIAAARTGTTGYLGVDLDLDKLLVARRSLRLAGRELDAVWRLRLDCLPMATPPAERFDTILVLDVLHYWPADGKLIRFSGFSPK